MLLPSALLGDKVKYWCAEDYEDGPEHTELRERLCKTLYYGRMPSMDRPSLAMTELAVEMFQDVAPKEFGRIDMDWAAAVSRDVVMSPSSLMLGMTYAKRLKKKDSPYRHKISSSDLFLVSVMMASKFLYDEGEEDSVVNDEWAASSHMEVDELNQLERNFLAAMDWELYVNMDEFWASLSAAEQQIALKQGNRRGGSFTYTDLTVLANSALCHSLCRLLLEVCKVIIICSTAYIASLSVLVAVQPILHISVFIASTLPTGSFDTVPNATTIVITDGPCFSSSILTTQPVSRPSTEITVASTTSLAEPAIEPMLPGIPSPDTTLMQKPSRPSIVANFLHLLTLTETIFGTASSVFFVANAESTECRVSCCHQCSNNQVCGLRNSSTVVDKRLHPVNEDHDPSTGLPANDAVRRHHCRLCHHHDLSQREQQQQQHQKFPTTADTPGHGGKFPPLCRRWQHTVQLFAHQSTLFWFSICR
jgi:hypothetical protein